MITNFSRLHANLMAGVALAALAFSAQSGAQSPPAAPATLFKNVRVFDGKGSKLTDPTNVLVRGPIIERIGAAAISTDATATVIDGKGRTLMPGLIDNHWHVMLVRPTPMALMADDVGYSTLVAGVEAADTLMRGFTTIRDLGGPAFSLKRAIDEGLVPGPRIYPSGAMITVTSGHGDFRQLWEVPRVIGGPLTRMELTGGSIVADSPDEVRVRVREQLMLGASQVKLTAGGGIASPHSPLDVSTFTAEELRAAVEAADNWGTYITVHAYTPRAMQGAIAAGVKCIEHGHLMDEATAKLMAEKGIWLSMQVFLDDQDAPPLPPNSPNRARFLQVVTGTDQAYNLAKKYKIKTAWGTDILFSPATAKRQGAQLVKLTKWFTPAELLRMATSTNAELLQLSGLRNPYPGKLGVVEEGALADLLLVEGNPLENVKLIEDPAKNFVVIMKNGVIYKDLTAAK